MNSHYEGMHCALRGDEICVDGKQFTVFAHMNEIGAITSFELLLNDKRVLLVNGETYSDLSRCLSLMSGEQMRRTVAHIKSNSEVK